jgi:hypothetical protein
LKVRCPKTFPTKGERPFYIGSPAICGQLDLRAGRTPPTQAVDDRRTKEPRNLTRLIEAALILTSPVQRHRYGVIDAAEQILSAQPHAGSERPRQ